MFHATRNWVKGLICKISKKTRFKHCAYVQNLSTILLFITIYDSSVLGKINLNLFYFSYICNHQYLKSAICFLWVKNLFWNTTSFHPFFLARKWTMDVRVQRSWRFREIKKGKSKNGVKMLSKNRFVKNDFMFFCAVFSA